MSERTVSRPVDEVQTAETEDVHVRNYDDEEHVLWLRVVDDGDRAFEHSYRLAGGACASELDALPAGRYDVEVELDGLRRWVDRCEVDDGSGVLVETGNGTVSITERGDR